MRQLIGLRLLALLLLALVCSSAVCAERAETLKPPDVLVLVLSGMGGRDQIGINYLTEVPARQAKADMDALAHQSGWLVEHLSIATRPSGAPGGKPTTSVTFLTPGVVNRTEGVLPLEPFIDTLKRFKTIQVNYILPGEFTFRGLKDFENEYVKLKLSNSGNSYAYRVQVKNGDFERLGLPLRQPPPEPKAQPGISSGARLALILGLAIVCSVAAYLVALYVSRSRA